MKNVIQHLDKRETDVESSKRRTDMIQRQDVGPEVEKGPCKTYSEKVQKSSRTNQDDGLEKKEMERNTTHEVKEEKKLSLFETEDQPAIRKKATLDKMSEGEDAIVNGRPSVQQVVLRPALLDGIVCNVVDATE
ncbi:unnamed protein product [Boreogadus saida]